MDSDGLTALQSGSSAIIFFFPHGTVLQRKNGVLTSREPPFRDLGFRDGLGQVGMSGRKAKMRAEKRLDHKLGSLRS